MKILRRSVSWSQCCSLSEAGGGERVTCRWRTLFSSVIYFLRFWLTPALSVWAKSACVCISLCSNYSQPWQPCVRILACSSKKLLCCASLKVVCLTTRCSITVLDFRRWSGGVAVGFCTLFHPHISQLSLVVSFIQLTSQFLLPLSLRNPAFKTNQAYSRWSHLALSLWLQQTQLWPCSYLPSNISQTTSRQPCRQVGRDYCSASPWSPH